MAEDAPASPTPVDTSVVANAAETDAPVASPKPDAPASESANASPKQDAAAADSEEAATKEVEETTPETNGSPAPSKTASAAAAVATPASKKKAVGKRKSLANLKTPNKKGADPDKKFTPGQYVMAKMKSYPPWPAIVLNDELLPEVLKKGPQQGKSKNAPTDTGPSAWKTQYPIFFMGTFEYAWTSIADLDELTDDLLKAGPSRKTKGLPEAFTAVEEGFSLKDVKDFQEGAMEVDDEPEAVEESDEMDVDEEEGSEQPSDDDEPKNKKKARGKKRKADTDEDAESEKPAKTPKKAPAAKTPKAKTPKSKPEAKTPKAKTPKTAAAAANGTKSAKKTPAAKKATPASKKKTPAKKSSETVEDSDEETAPKEDAHKDEIVDTKGLNIARQQEVMLFRRHKLQKVFLNKDDTPVTAAEMPRMAKYLESLENWENLTAEVIRNTKIHKVVKGIFKLKAQIPLDDEYHFRERCQALFEKWTAVLDADKAKENGEAPADDKKTNGDDKEEEVKEDEAKEETTSEDKPEEEEESKDEPTKAVDVVKETPLADAKEDTPAAAETTDVVVGEEKKDTPAVVTETTETTKEKPVVEEASVEEPTT